MLGVGDIGANDRSRGRIPCLRESRQHRSTGCLYRVGDCVRPGWVRSPPRTVGCSLVGVCTVHCLDWGLAPGAGDDLLAWDASQRRRACAAYGVLEIAWATYVSSTPPRRVGRLGDDRSPVAQQWQNYRVRSGLIGTFPTPL